MIRRDPSPRGKLTGHEGRTIGAFGMYSVLGGALALTASRIALALGYQWDAELLAAVTTLCGAGIQFGYYLFRNKK